MNLTRCPFMGMISELQDIGTTYQLRLKTEMRSLHVQYSPVSCSAQW